MGAWCGVGMSNIQYKIWQWLGPTNEGSNEQYNVAVCTKAKRSERNQYEIANEMLCLRLAQVLHLPVPAGGLLTKDGKQYFSSLEYALAPQRLPPCTESDCIAIANQSWLACGIIAFDAWTVNEERRDANICFVRRTGETYLIDHGNSPFWDSPSINAVDYLKSVRNELVVDEFNHCIAKHVTNLDDFTDWNQRINDIPEYYIREAVEESGQLGLSREQVAFGIDFLLDRRERLKVLFAEFYRTAFPKLDRQRSIFDPFDLSGDINYSI